VYSRRMDSQYARTVVDREVVVQFSSGRDGWTSSWSSSCAAGDAWGTSSSAGLITEDRATAAQRAASSSKPRSIGPRMPATSGAMKAGKTTRRISGGW